MRPQRLQAAQIILVARIAHETNRAYCEAIGDHSQVAYDDAPEWQQKSSLDGVVGVAEGRVRGPGDSHRSWLAEKDRDGWKYGTVKNPEAKEHPCMVSFEELPAEQQMKDHLFFGVVSAMLRGLT